MGRPTRIAGVARLSLTTIAIASTLVGVVSAWRALGCAQVVAPGSRYWWVEGGRMGVSRDITFETDRPGCYANPSPYTWSSWQWLGFELQHNQAGSVFAVPVWLVPTLAGVPALFLWTRRDRSATVCAKCGYDRRGLVGGADAKCPECGTTPTPRAGRLGGCEGRGGERRRSGP